MPVPLARPRTLVTVTKGGGNSVDKGAAVFFEISSQKKISFSGYFQLPLRGLINLERILRLNLQCFFLSKINIEKSMI